MSADNIANSITNMEQDHCNDLAGANEATPFDSLVRVHFHSVRKRLADSDGISGKACLDGIVEAGILHDDSPAYVKDVTHSQEKGKEEYTIITISKA